MKPATTQAIDSDVPPGGVILEANGLQLGYGNHPVLDQVDIRVRSGEFWFLIGPNGHGKTTLLLGMLGQLRPSGGRLLRQGDFARPTRIGFVPQQCSTNPTLPTTVREFVGLGLVGIGVRPRRAGRATRLGAGRPWDSAAWKPAISGRFPAGSGSGRWWRGP